MPGVTGHTASRWIKVGGVIVALLIFPGLDNHALAADRASDKTRSKSTTLTPWGAVKEGNRDRTIPEYTGGLPTTTAPPGFVRGSGRWTDPFGDEKPLYTITAGNLEKYRDKLSEASQEMLQRLPTFRIDVYPSHRVVNYPKFFVDNSRRNFSRCRTIEGELALAGCFGGTPFPIPKTGAQQMWNVQLAYRPPLEFFIASIYVDPMGNTSITGKRKTAVALSYFDPSHTVESFYASGGHSLDSLTIHTFPPHIAGDKTLVNYFIDPVKNVNTMFKYQHHNRRVVTVPDAQYDYPIVASGGNAFLDESGLYLGKMDRYDFKLLGTREMILPYNNYRAAYAPKEQMVTEPSHPNPDLLRWELHRVVVVEATLKPGMRHVLAKRRWYIDEDYPAWGMADSWDHGGRLYRGYFSLGFWMYDQQAAWHLGAISMDLRSGGWFVRAHLGDEGEGLRVLNAYPPKDFYSPEEFARRAQQ